MAAARLGLVRAAFVAHEPVPKKLFVGSPKSQPNGQFLLRRIYYRGLR